MLRGPGPTVLLVAAALLAAPSGGRAQVAPSDERRSSVGEAPKPPPPQATAAAQAAQAPRTAQLPRPAQAPLPAKPAADAPYTVECGPDPEGSGTLCLVDRDTYIGWRTFHGICHTCHAQDAVGSSFAPNLLERMKEIDKAQFLESVDQGFTGQTGVMPAWSENPNVNKYYEQLWSYLRARADGALLPGRPKRLPDSR